MIKFLFTSIFTLLCFWGNCIPLIDSYLMIKCEIEAKVKIDGEDVGLLKAKEYKRFTIIAGDHIIKIESLDGTNYWEGKVYTPPGQQAILEPILIPSDPSSGILSNFIDPRDQIKYKTVKIRKHEWFAENYGQNTTGSYASDYGRLYKYDQISPPPGWRIPTKGDFESLLSEYSDPIKELGNGGKSNFNLNFPGYMEAGTPLNKGEFIYIWTSTSLPKQDGYRRYSALKINVVSKEIKFVDFNLGWQSGLSVRFVRDIQ